MTDKQTGQEPTKPTNYVALGLSMGLAIGTGIGVTLSVATDNPGLLAIGIGCGLTMGVGIGNALQRQHEGENAANDGPMVKVDGDQGGSGDRPS